MVATGFSISPTRPFNPHMLGSYLVHNRHEDQYWYERCNPTFGHLILRKTKRVRRKDSLGNFLAPLSATVIIECLDLPGGSHPGVRFR